MKTIGHLAFAFVICAANLRAQEAINESQKNVKVKAAYEALTDSEQKRIDSIREKIKDGLVVNLNNVGPDLDKRDLDWAWNGAGRAVLHDELLTAARKSNGLGKSVEVFKLTPEEIVEYSINHHQLFQDLSIANRLMDDMQEVTDRQLQKYRDDPLLEPFVTDRIKRFRDPAYAAQADKQRIGKWITSLTDAQTELAELQGKLPELEKQAEKDRAALSHLKAKPLQNLDNSLPIAEKQSTASSRAVDECQVAIKQCEYRINEAQQNLNATTEGQKALQNLGREQQVAQTRNERAQKEQDEAKKQEVIAQARTSAKKNLRHTFTSASGTYSVDATIVKVDNSNQKVDLIRMSDNQLIKVELDKLSDADREWITNNATKIQIYGQAIASDLQKAATGQGQ